MKFGKKSTPSEKAKMVEKRYGKTLKGAAKKPTPKTTVKPKGNLKGKVGFTVEKKW